MATVDTPLSSAGCLCLPYSFLSLPVLEKMRFFEGKCFVSVEDIRSYPPRMKTVAVDGVEGRERLASEDIPFWKYSGISQHRRFLSAGKAHTVQGEVIEQ